MKNGPFLQNLDQFRLMVESIQDYAIFMLDPEGNVATWNAGAQRIKGYRTDEIVGQHFSKFYSIEDRAAGKPERVLETARRTGKFEEENWRIRKDGSRFWAHVLVTELRSQEGQRLGFVKVTRDLTERKIAEEKLHLSEERFRLLVEGVQDYAILMLDPQGHVASWNAGAERINGYRADEIIGQHFSKFYPPQDIADDKPQRELRIAAEIGKYAEEGWRLRKDGSRFWAGVLITAIRDRQGRLTGFSKVTRDLTERKIAEESLKHANARLELRVQERTRDLELANENLREEKRMLEKVNLELDNFIYIASHDLRSPLRTIVSYIQIALQDIRGQISADNAQMLDDAVDAALRMNTLIEDLLTLSRVSRIQNPITTVPSGKFVDEAVKRLQGQIREHRVRVDISGDFPEIMCDRIKLTEVFVNLLNNAIKFSASPDGKETVVEMKYEDAGAFHRFCVRDEGIGIEPRYHTSIFEMFNRLHDPAAYEGTGLGLYIARKIVEAHKGRIWVESEPGKGSSFHFTILKNLAGQDAEPEPSGLEDSPMDKSSAGLI